MEIWLLMVTITGGGSIGLVVKLAGCFGPGNCSSIVGDWTV